MQQPPANEQSPLSGGSCIRRGPTWIIFAIALIGSFSAGYPHGAINVLLPTIAADLSIDTSLIVIVSIAYSLVSGVLTLPFGRLGDRIGYQKLFIMGQAVLLAANLLSGFLAVSLIPLVLLRALLAVGAAMVQSVVQAMLAQAYPNSRGRMMGIYSMSVSYSGAFSPFISGAVSDASSWRMALMFGGIFSAAALILGIVFLGKFQCRPTRSDRLGTALLVITLSSLLMAFNARTITITTPVMIALLAVFAVALILFIRVENRAEAPLLDFRLLRDKRFALGFVGCLLGYIVSTGTNQALPFFIQNIKGQTATVSSLCTMGFTLVMGTLGPFTGGWCDKKGPFRYMLAAQCIQTAAVVGYATLNEGSPLAFVVACVVIYGLGGGLFYAPITSMVMGSVPPSSGGLASGMMNTARNLGAGIGASIFSLVVGIVAANSSAALTANQVYVNGQRAVMFIMLALNVLNIILMLTLYLTFGRKKKAA